MIYNKADKISCFTLPIRNQHKMSLYHYYTIKAYFWFARHGRALMGESPEHA
jgi:hypothetical protein